MIIDARSRRILGRAFSNSLETSLVIKAARMAVALRGGTVPAELILHSDRGVQYATPANASAPNWPPATSKHP